MIVELKKTEFDKIEHLLIGERINLEIVAVVQGYNPGWVFVDNPDKPKTALVWSKGIEGFYFIGDHTNSEFTEDIYGYSHEQIINRAKNMGLTRFEFSGTSDEWDQTLEKIFVDKKLHRSKQFVYECHTVSKSVIHCGKLPMDTEIKSINEEFLNSEAQNIDFIVEIILEWWNTIEDYLKYGVGFCIIYNDKIVSSCVSSFVTKEAMESHIITVDGYRKRGFAKLAVKEFMRFCHTKNYTLYWDCMEDNFGSRALAEGLGYSKKHEYKLYSFGFENT